jgi:ribulose-phosphate 3-epimerase
MTLKLAPSILSADFGHLAEEIGRVADAGADWIHVDVMDGHFVPNITIGPLVVKAARRVTNLPLDVHLMIENPELYIEDFVEAGADRISVHQETCPHLHRTLEQIRSAGALPGVAINPATPVDTVTEVLTDLDLLLIMTVNPGFGGQAFIESSVGKIERARRMLEDRGVDVPIQVDGGVGPGTAGRVVGAGASVLVAGSAVFGHPEGAAAGVRALRAEVDPHDGSEPPA